MGLSENQITPFLATNIPGPVAGFQEGLYISQKRSKGNFVLVRGLDSCFYSVIHFVAIEGQVQQMEVRYINNPYEVEQIKRTKKLCSEGLYVDLQAVSVEEYERFVRIAKRYLKEVLRSGRNE